MAEKLAYWLADAVADNLMSPAFNTFSPIIIQTVKFAKDFLTNRVVASDEDVHEGWHVWLQCC